MELLEGRSGWTRILLARADHPEAATDIDAAESTGAWGAWRTAIGSLTPKAVIEAVARSGLRGRGGAGFPTAEKWRICREAQGSVRYVVANGFEADPGAQADRTLMETDPHAVVEGVALAAYAVGATQAYLAINAAYGTAADRLRAAVAAAVTRGYLGPAVMGSSVRLEVEVRPVSGSFVAGEETVLLRALEQRRAQPDQRPPYPAVRGLWGAPTVVNNVATLAAIPWIVANGAEAHAAIGAPESPGTLLVQVTGAVGRPGLVEAPTGTSLRDLLDLAGGATGALKALLVGGPSGGFLPPDQLDLPLGYASLREAGAHLGSGTLTAVDSSACIVELATMLTRFLSDEACGKTIPCRIGTRRLAELGAGFCSGRCRPSDGALVADLAADIRAAALCGLESTAVLPLLSGMRYFAGEFEDHIVRGSCPARVCRPIRAAAADPAEPSIPGARQQGPPTR